MAATKQGSVILLASSGDKSSEVGLEDLHVRSLLVTNSGVAAVIVTVTDSAGSPVALFTVNLPANASLAIPFGQEGMHFSKGLGMTTAGTAAVAVFLR